MLVMYGYMIINTESTILLLFQEDLLSTNIKGTDPPLKKLSNIPEMYAKMLKTFY